jgi:hypothetical protein
MMATEVRFLNNVKDSAYLTSRGDPYEHLRNVAQLWQHNKHWMKPLFRHPHRRAQAMDRPSQEKRVALVGARRRYNRVQVSFFCRYIIAKKNLKIPLKF